MIAANRHKQETSQNPSQQYSWHLVQCKPKQEQRAQEQLDNQGFECFLPWMKVEKIKKGKRCECEEPLFPGYLFVQQHTQGQNLGSIRSTKGVRQLVSFGGKPAQVPQTLIDSLKAQSQQDTQPQASLTPGQTLRISQGPFAQLEAIFQCFDGEERVVVLLNMLQKQHRIKVPISDICAA